jgi:RNA polymerase sigma-70 factor, ECF subfamily
MDLSPLGRLIRRMAQPDHAEDLRLTRALLAGEPTVFDRFFHEYFPRLYRFVLPRVDQDVATAQDICQQVLARALRKLGSYRGDAALFTWLCRLARNELADHWALRQRDSARLVHLEDDATIRAVLESMESGDGSGPEALRFGEELGRYVQIALDHLPLRYGDVLEWKYVDGLPVHEIAARLNLSSVATQSMLQRARAAFREAFVTVAGGSLDNVLNPSVS